MDDSSGQSTPLLVEAVKSSALRADVLDAMARVYDDIQAAIDARRPVCVASGRCCRFEEFGHRLYVSTLELAAFVAKVPDGRRQVESSAQSTDLSAFILQPSALSPGCPFQESNLCTVHAIRPFGCRMFFCDATSTEWQNEAYERFHAEIKRLHESLGVPYFYVEWRTALAAMGLLKQADESGVSPTR